MLYIIFALNIHLALVSPVREDTARDEHALVVSAATRNDEAQERDLQGRGPYGHMEWGAADTPKNTSVCVPRPVFHVKWATGVLGCE
jgi:hypothetical protein